MIRSFEGLDSAPPSRLRDFIADLPPSLDPKYRFEVSIDRSEVPLRKRRKTEISLEIEEAVAIRMNSILIADCRGCRKQTRMVAANEAAMIAKLSTREIYRLVEAGRLHFSEDQNGLLFVCLASLRQLAGEFDPNQ